MDNFGSSGGGAPLLAQNGQLKTKLRTMLNDDYENILLEQNDLDKNRQQEDPQYYPQYNQNYYANDYLQNNFEPNIYNNNYIPNQMPLNQNYGGNYPPSRLYEREYQKSNNNLQRQVSGQNIIYGNKINTPLAQRQMMTPNNQNFVENGMSLSALDRPISSMSTKREQQRMMAEEWKKQIEEKKRREKEEKEKRIQQDLEDEEKWRKYNEERNAAEKAKLENSKRMQAEINKENQSKSKNSSNDQNFQINSPPNTNQELIQNTPPPNQFNQIQNWNNEDIYNKMNDMNYYSLNKTAEDNVTEQIVKLKNDINKQYVEMSNLFGKLKMDVEEANQLKSEAERELSYIKDELLKRKMENMVYENKLNIALEKNAPYNNLHIPLKEVDALYYNQNSFNNLRQDNNLKSNSEMVYALDMVDDKTSNRVRELSALAKVGQSLVGESEFVPIQTNNSQNMNSDFQGNKTPQTKMPNDNMPYDKPEGEFGDMYSKLKEIENLNSEIGGGINK